ncbi:cytochrome o ubiquinol oxidase subunit IV [Marinobacterium stanieri]|uniref:cytochrome o ubiquinol oxidase subunit IV n=1 Tax=Marinobacterium stanieri TaxID=49186 RepID=UPI003A91CD13
MSSHHDAAHGSVKSYAVGFLLSVVLTVVPFWLVMSGGFDKWTTVITILVFAVVQIAVHLKYFLHLTLTNEEGRLNTLTFLFSALIIVLVVGLSIWIIYASNAMMMH